MYDVTSIINRFPSCSAMWHSSPIAKHRYFIIIINTGIVRKPDSYLF